MILEGPNTKCQSLGESSQPALTLAKLLKFNSVKHARKTEEGIRHVKSEETPLPVYIGIMLHVKTRKKELIDRLHTDYMLLGCRFRITCYGYRQIWQTQFVNTSRKSDTECPPTSKRTYSLQPATSSFHGFVLAFH